MIWIRPKIFIIVLTNMCKIDQMRRMAGEGENKAIQNPFLDQASDFVVEVDEARLEGCESFVIVPALHSFFMKNTQVQEFVVDFLCR